MLSKMEILHEIVVKNPMVSDMGSWNPFLRPPQGPGLVSSENADLFHDCSEEPKGLGTLSWGRRDATAPPGCGFAIEMKRQHARKLHVVLLRAERGASARTSVDDCLKSPKALRVDACQSKHTFAATCGDKRKHRGLRA